MGKYHRHSHATTNLDKDQNNDDEEEVSFNFGENNKSMILSSQSRETGGSGFPARWGDGAVKEMFKLVDDESDYK